MDVILNIHHIIKVVSSYMTVTWTFDFSSLCGNSWNTESCQTFSHKEMPTSQQHQKCKSLFRSLMLFTASSGAFRERPIIDRRCQIKSVPEDVTG